MPPARAAIVSCLTVLVLFAAPLPAATPPGIVYEAEAVCEPKSAWLQDRGTADHWNLWTKEEDIANKRSGGAVLASPAVAADRENPSDGAPPLHAVITDLKPGWYQVYVSAPGGRPLAYSLNGQDWRKYVGGELDLGRRELKDGRFELWVDDRYAHPPGMPGPGYFDYLRFVPIPAAAMNVLRFGRTFELDRAVRRKEVTWVPATSLAVKGFTDLADGVAAATAKGATLTYTFAKPGKTYAAVRFADGSNGAVQVRLLLNGREEGAIADPAPYRLEATFALKQPLTVKAGDKLTVEVVEPGRAVHVRGLYLSDAPIAPPPPAIRHLEVWSPAPGEVHLCWVTGTALGNGQVTFQADGQPEQSLPLSAQTARNHEAVLTGLDPNRRYRATVTMPAGEATVASDPVTFTPRPPTPPAAAPLSIPLTVPAPTGTARVRRPAVVGVPFGRGQLGDVARLRLTDAQGRAVPCQADLFSRWPDGSVKWATISFLADAAPDAPGRYRLESGGEQPGQAPAVTVTTNDEAWLVRSSAIAFSLGKKLPALFSQVGYDRNGDGTIAADEHLAAEPLGANLKLETGDGTFRTCGPPASFAVESNGPVRAVLHWRGPLIDQAGKPAWWYDLRATIWQGLPELALQVTVINDQPQPTFAPVRTVALRVPLDAAGGIRGGFDGGALEPVPDADGLWLHQDRDDRFTRRAPGGLSSGARATGVALARDDRDQVAVAIADFWQTCPSGLAIKPDGVHVRLLPPLAADTYADADGQKWFLKLYPWFRDGAYLFKRGQAVQSRVYARYAPAGQALDPMALADDWNEPLVPQPPADYLCATEVLGGPLFAAGKGLWERYDGYFARGFEELTRNREQERSWGWMHFGDWFGERICNYGNNEYDLSYAAPLQWLRTGDRRYLDRGLEMARHHSTVDTVHGAFSDSWSGLVYEHSLNHVGADLSRDDPRLKEGDWARYMAEFATGMFDGAIDRQGHVFQPGNWLTAALTGDGWLRDVAERVCRNQAVMLTPAFDFTIERSGGWPLIDMVAAYASSGDPFYLNAARIMAERAYERQHPLNGGWPHFHAGSETDGQQVYGGKAFAVGILSHGLLRYLEQDPQAAEWVAPMVVAGADWLMTESWAPNRGFRYISNAANYANSGGKGLTSMLNTEIIAFAYERTRDDKYRRFFSEMMMGQLDRSPGGMGKGFTQGVRQTVFGLERMHRMEVDDLAPKVEVMARRLLALEGGQASLTVAVRNPAVRAAAARVKVVSGAAPAEVTWSAAPGDVSVGPALALSGKPGQAEVEVSLAGAEPVRLAIRLTAAPPLGAPARGRGVAYVGPEESATRRGLRAAGFDLPAVTDPVKADLSRYAGLIVAADSWHSATVDLPGAAARLAEFARRGGRLAVFQLNDDSWQPDWLPHDLFVADQDSQVGGEPPADHPLFNSPKPLGPLAGAKEYDRLLPVASPWRALLKDRDGGPAVIEAVHGHGRVLVIEPSFDRYAAGGADAPDAAVSEATARAFLANLVAYLSA